MKIENTQHNIEPSISVLDSIIFHTKPHSSHILEEFNEISKIEQNPTLIAQLPENIHKNRYESVKPADFSRIVLETSNYFFSDYINASLIEETNNSLKNKYIATQGPLENTVVDFYRMILQFNVTTIVMMTDFCENGIVKCFNYLPNQSSLLLFADNIKIEFKHSETLPFAVITTLLISSKNKSLNVKHFQFTLWPDQSIPQSCQYIIDFEKLVRNWTCNNLSPIVVHCSAGVGRTGSFIVIYHSIQKILNNIKNLNIKDFVKTMRLSRPLMVQTFQQYQFIYDTIDSFHL